MIELKEQYISIKLTDDIADLGSEITSTLRSSLLNNVLIEVKNENQEIDALASFLEKELETSNGLACFVGVKELMNSPSLKGKNHVIALPTEHEGVEAIMMNILENEFLKGE
ncbi:hypothetical protein SAMN06298216_0466 [Spirosomataceae bacterium TFI 002]|nr:hypothetical protein SAMN06298216_0466 [Spirosomataceae bacterium TFI 002]